MGRHKWSYIDLVELALDLVMHRNRVKGGGCAKRKRAKRQGYTEPDLAMVDRGQFQAGAAKITDDAAAIGRTGQHAEGRIARLFCAAQYPDTKTGFLFDPLHKVWPVLGFAHSGGRGNKHRGERCSIKHGAEPANGREAGGNAVGG